MLGALNYGVGPDAVKFFSPYHKLISIYTFICLISNESVKIRDKIPHFHIVMMTVSRVNIALIQCHRIYETYDHKCLSETHPS